MINLYNYIEIIETFNIVMILSILLISIFLYQISKDLSFLGILSIYTIEIGLYLFLYQYNYSEIYTSKNIYLVSFIYIIKSVLLLLFSKQAMLSRSLKIVTIIGNILAILFISSRYEFTVMINIVVNTVIVNKCIIEKIKIFNNDLYKNIQKLKTNKRYISKSTQQISQEYNLQNQYKNEILRLNEKVIRSVEEVSTPIFILNKDKQYIYGNKTFEELTKSDYVKFSNLNIIEYINNKFINSEEVLDIIKNINLESSKNININTYDNKIYRFICSTDIMDGECIVICILNDITQSTIIQRKLKESEERYRNLMDILSDGVIIHNMNTISYINNKAIELFELDESIKKVWLIDDIKYKISKKFRQDFLKNINLVQLGKKDKSITKIETDGGKIIEFVTTSISLNEKQMMLSLAIDITTLENAMSELEQSEKTYKLLLQTLPEGIVIIDKKTKNYIYRNKAMIKLLKSIGSDNLNEIVKDYIDKKEYGKFKKFEIDLIERIDISIAIIDMKEDGNFLVVVRTLQNSDKVEKIAEKLSEIKAKYKFKTEFLASVTKDIKKPINIIYNTNKILDINKDQYQSENIDNYTRLVKQNCNRLMRLLNNIEEIEKIENGKSTMKFDEVDIIKLIKNIVDLSGSYINEKGLKIDFKSNIDNKILLIDKEKITKIILNILANAMKFTEVGGKIEVEIKIIQDEVHISIKDDGVGIPQDKIGVIFEDFEQVDRTLSRGAEGTGIGLSLVKKLVDLHGGKVRVKSQIGKGSEFEVILKNNESHEIDNMRDSDDNFIDKEKIDMEFSDIYLNLN